MLQRPLHDALLNDLQFAAEMNVTDPGGTALRRREKLKRLRRLAKEEEPLDNLIWERMAESVKIAAGTLRLGLLTVLIFILTWPDWQLTSLFTRASA